ncbi:DNA polymerase 2 alpha 70 kda subunit [Anaeramoeba flamelloides]|uniref:DNA polymerase alpha subunit B n=1 Tax=Anaeramoeba flamelloides TaxID=1746091 RepID=A0AAV7Z9K4_9EUKA|nr:DNA polymerase 2 alpha 70 kda subunit [Anaeramoeba flamelloides]
MTTQTSKYKLRKNSGKKEIIFNVDLIVPEVDSFLEYHIRSLVPTKSEKELYMYEEIEFKVQELEKRLMGLGEKLQKVNKVKDVSFIVPSSQEPICILGRVCMEDPKLTTNNIMIEGSLERDNGRRVSLDLSQLNDYSFFAGQVVLIRGTIPTEGRMKVMGYLDTVYPPRLQVRVGSILNYQKPRSLKEQSIESVLEQIESNKNENNPETETKYFTKIIVTKGPYETLQGDDQCLSDLLKLIKTESPDIIMLIGPFLSDKSDYIKFAQGEQTFFNDFQNRMGSWIQVVNQTFSKTKTKTPQIILIPDLSDVVNEFVFPQPPFKWNLFGQGTKPKNVHLHWNPSMIRINELLIGCVSNDTLFDLSRQEISKSNNKIQNEKIPRLIDHFFKQQSFYPIYPGSDESMLSLSHQNKLKIPFLPDIMIFSSRLKYFVKEVNGVICINPGSLTTGNTGGTFAKIVILPPTFNDENEDEDSLITNQINQRTRVEVIRI